MVDKERVLSKIDALDAYLAELKQIAPENFSAYQAIEKKRSCERLLQLCVECIVDVAKLLVSGLRLGIPAEENDLFDKLQKKGILSKEINLLLKKMRGLRNVLVHEYATVDDELVFQVINSNLSDFAKFKSEILKALNKS